MHSPRLLRHIPRKSTMHREILQHMTRRYEQRRDARTNENIATCAIGGARRRFSTGRIAKWQPAGLLYVQEIYRLRPFRRAKGRPRSLWQQTGGSQHLPFYFPGCEPPASPSLALFASSDSVAPSCSFHHGARPFFLLVFLSFLCFFAVVVPSFALQSLKRRREPLRSVIPSVAVLSMEFPTNKRTNATLKCDIIIGLPALANISGIHVVTFMKVRKHKI